MRVKSMKFYRSSRIVALGLAAIALVISSIPHRVAFAETSFDRIATKQQPTLKEGQVAVTGSEGQYLGRLLIKAPIETAWEVLTDYDNFERFLPNVSDSQLLESNGNTKVFEQTNVAKVFFVTKKTRVRIETKETYPNKIDFRAIEGDIKSLQGVWRIQPTPNGVLIEHQVAIDPGSENRDLFFALYQNGLVDTLEALKQEIKRRS